MKRRLQTTGECGCLVSGLINPGSFLSNVCASSPLAEMLNFAFGGFSFQDVTQVFMPRLVIHS